MLQESTGSIQYLVMIDCEVDDSGDTSAQERRLKEGHLDDAYHSYPPAASVGQDDLI